MKLSALFKRVKSGGGKAIMEAFTRKNIIAVIVIVAGLTASVALAAATVSFFARDPNAAKYDLNARVPADVSVTKQYIVDYKLHQPDGKYKVFGGRFDADASSMAADRFEWRIGPNSLQGDAAAHKIHPESGPLRADVTLKT